MTFLRWAGSKKQMIDVLLSCWYASNGNDEERRYIEAFSGSAALFFALNPARALLIDINRDLQECFNEVKKSPEKVYVELGKFSPTEIEYYRIRALDKSTLTSAERAARFIYLNRFCFNGLYRTNRQGAFNVPWGGVRNGSLPSFEELSIASDLLKSAEISCGDFFDILLADAGERDFIYLDPPYAKRNRDLDNQYGPDVFGMNDIDRLGKLVNILNDRGAKFVISYAKCEEIDVIANRWIAHEVSVKRSIAANVKHRGPAVELLITNI